jgi:hypothetical protein
MDLSSAMSRNSSFARSLMVGTRPNRSAISAMAPNAVIRLLLPTSPATSEIPLSRRAVATSLLSMLQLGGGGAPIWVGATALQARQLGGQRPVGVALTHHSGQATVF